MKESGPLFRNWMTRVRLCSAPLQFAWQSQGDCITQPKGCEERATLGKQPRFINPDERVESLLTFLLNLFLLVLFFGHETDSLVSPLFIAVCQPTGALAGRCHRRTLK